MTSDGSQQPQASSEKRVFLSAGGTGGHMFPAFALAHELRNRGVDVALVTDVRGAKYQTQYKDIPFHVVRAETLRPGFLAKIRMIFLLLIGTGQAYLLLRKQKPAVVVGFGGYPSFPTVLAAQALGITTFLHEQNAVLGRANQLVATKAKHIALSLPSLSSLPQSLQAKAIFTGNPVRTEIAAVGRLPYVPPTHDFKLLVLGGSQGASVFSKVVPAAIGLLPDELRSRIRIVQQCRAADIAEVRHAYDVLGVQARLETFVTDVPAQLADCHLLIARSGASTVSEAAVAGRPAIFVPYPYHKDQQQKVNAGVLVAAGAAILLEEKGLNSQILAKELEKLAQTPQQLGQMAEAARNTLPADAARRLADAILAL
ncbi:MAG: undecaprenyldiphospho-muramoylpentapeptide beta-N-acetylglucosaminyltransferase [Proteobacteria bacterium]|nr:undecaprenyldiphospho-muramoylpentapeptide beta-N-acetylglucosaminyltransferase [Pseudomonadota bacterium]